MSLNWFVFGHEVAAKRAELVARIGSHGVASVITGKLFHLPEDVSEIDPADRMIEGKALKYWCDDLAEIAGDNAYKLASAKPMYLEFAKQTLGANYWCLSIWH